MYAQYAFTHLCSSIGRASTEGGSQDHRRTKILLRYVCQKVRTYGVWSATAHALHHNTISVQGCCICLAIHGVHRCLQSLYIYELVCLSHLILLQLITFTCSWTGPHASFASANVMHLQAYSGHGCCGSVAVQLAVQEPTTKRSREDWLQKRWLVYACRPTFVNQPGVPAVIVYEYFPSCSKVLSPCKPTLSNTAKILIQFKGYFICCIFLVINLLITGIQSTDS